MFEALGLVLFYRALAIGVMSLVAPIAACGALVPVLLALARGEPLGVVPAGGIMAALVGVVLVSIQPEKVAPAHAPVRAAVPLALGAALALRLLFCVCLDQGASGGAPAPVWAVAGTRLSSLPTLGVLIAATVRRVPAPGRQFAPMAAVSVLDTVANALFAYAATHGTAGVVAVLGSLYPVARCFSARCSWASG